jgi:hypothetical protein
VKATAVTSAIVVAGAGVGARVVHTLESTAPVHHHHKVTARSASSAPAASITPTTTLAGKLTSTHNTTSPKPAAKAPTRPHVSPPSKSLGYLAIGKARATNRRLQRYRTGTEGRISHLKRRYGLDRSRLKGYEGQRIWTEWGILAYDADTLAVRCVWSRFLAAGDEYPVGCQLFERLACRAGLKAAVDGHLARGDPESFELRDRVGQ